MNGGEEAPANVSFVRHCMVCEQPFSARTRKAKNCGERECIAFMTDFRESSMVELLLHNMRCRGGSGLESSEELMRAAVENLAIDEGPLADLLIEIYEWQDLPSGYSPW
jgi:hypothetical protein